MDSSLNMNTLASSLPTSNLANAEAELMDNFKAAALSITTLYRSSLNTSKQAYNAGYAAACTDLLSVIQQGVSLGGAGEEGEGGMTIGRVMDWVEARLEAIRTREEEEDEEREGGGGARNKAKAAGRRDKRDMTPPTPSTSHAQRRAPSPPSTQRRQSPSTPSAPAPAPAPSGPVSSTPPPSVQSTADTARPPAPVPQATLTPPTHPRPLLRSKTRSQKELNHNNHIQTATDPFTFTPGPTAPLFADVFPSHVLPSSTLPATTAGGGGKLVEGAGGGNTGSVTIGAKRRHAAMLDSSPVSSADGMPPPHGLGNAYTVFSPSGLGNGNVGSSRKRTKSGRGTGSSYHHSSSNNNNNILSYGSTTTTATMANATSGYNHNPNTNEASLHNSLNVLQPNNGNASSGDAMDVEDDGSGRERKRVSRR